MLEVVEIPIYSDFAFSLPEFDLGPYQLQHAFPAEPRDPAMLLHARIHLGAGDWHPPMDRPDLRGFTGASLGDELAAMLSLVNGGRLAAGDVTRTKTNVGHVQVFADRRRPRFFSPPTDMMLGTARVLPQLGERITVAVGLLEKYQSLPPDTAAALVRSARSYRDAIWIAEAEPELSWLLLVTALEIAATHEQMLEPPLETLKAAKPEMADELTRIAPAVAIYVADTLARELRATARFRTFMKKYAPAAPSVRPEFGQLDWSPEGLDRAMVKIYQHRSSALHEGIPFPSPICRPPTFASNQRPTEVPFGLATATAGGVWMASDLPMYLHTFEHLARGALLEWWKALALRHGPHSDAGAKEADLAMES